MARNKMLVILAFGVLMGTMAVAAFAEAPVMELYDPAVSSTSTDVQKREAQADAWELRESMETGALPDGKVSSPDAACCGGIDGSTVEIGGALFRPEIDSGPQRIDEPGNVAFIDGVGMRAGPGAVSFAADGREDPIGKPMPAIVKAAEKVEYP